MVPQCSGGSNTALLRVCFILFAGICAHALPSEDVVPDVLPKVQLDGVLAEVSGVPPVAQQADGILAEASPAVLLADPITAAPSTGWPEQSCHETKLVWICIMIFFVFIIIMKSCKDYHKPKIRADGKTFMGFSRTEAGFTPDLGSAAATPIEFSADISFRPGANAKNKEFCRSIFRAVQNVLGSMRPVSRAGFGAALTGLLAAYYTEAGSGSDYDKEMEKLSSFYNTVEFLPLLFLGFYCAEEMARLFALMGEISNLSGFCVDFSLTLASNYMPPVRSQQDRAWLFKMYRYINLTHWLVYSQLVFGRDDLDIDELVASGLLLKSEKKPFEAASGSVSGSGWRGDSHNVIVAWMTQEYRSKFPRDNVTNVALSQLADISRIGGDLKERATLFYPVLMYNFLMHVFVYGMVFLVAIAFAYDFWVESDCWQIISVTATFFLCWTYFAILRLTESLNMPFDVNNSASDLLNPEAVLLETEANIFAVMRSGFEGESWTRFSDPDTNCPMSQARYENLQEVAWSTETSITELSAAVEVQQN